MPAIFDHIVFVLVAVAQPILGYRSFQKLLRLAASGQAVPLRDIPDYSLSRNFSASSAAMQPAPAEVMACL